MTPRYSQTPSWLHNATTATPLPLNLNKLRKRGVSRSGGTHWQPKPHRKVRRRRQALLLELPHRRCNNPVKAEQHALYGNGSSQEDAPITNKRTIRNFFKSQCSGHGGLVVDFPFCTSPRCPVASHLCCVPLLGVD
jgi:hypothetical protein